MISSGYLLSDLVGKTIEYDPSNIKVWPNPYFAYNPEERNRFESRDTFYTSTGNRGDAQYVIFDLAGTLIRKLNIQMALNLKYGMLEMIIIGKLQAECTLYILKLKKEKKYLNWQLFSQAIKSFIEQ